MASELPQERGVKGRKKRRREGWRQKGKEECESRRHFKKNL